jgi:thioester reductase-like protein
MPERRGILLTGATGSLGRYLLRDLLVEGRAVTVLVRGSDAGQAPARIAAIVDFWSTRLGRRLPIPTVLSGDLVQIGLGLTGADRNWLGRQCRTVVHCAASLSLCRTREGEPWRTNVEGTRSLLALCRQVGLSEWHQVSTAFVCGRRTGLIAEDDGDTSRGFHNAYEESKWQAEQVVRETSGIGATIYRPAVIVGDSRTGYASSFHGLYRFLELAARLASGPAGLPLRLPLCSDEVWNLVCVDWVSRAMVALLARPHWHGRPFHLVARSSVSTRFVRDVAAAVLDLAGVQLVGREGVTNPSRQEQWFLEGLREYWPYFAGNPRFTSTNTNAALPDLPPPRVDRPLLERLIRFAVANRWGRSDARSTKAHRDVSSLSSCAEYIERIFPRQARQSQLAREAGLNLAVGIDLHGPGGGQWCCQWNDGELIAIKRGSTSGAAIIYHTDTTTFQAIVSGRETPQEAFFEQRIAITGDLESALKLAVLFAQFLAENPTSRCHRMEVLDSTSIQC